MQNSHLNLKTENASKYLQQLCKHFGHKVPVSFTKTKGEVSLPFGNCELMATENTLSVKVSGDTHNVSNLERFIGDHLARFAFREKPELHWQRAA